MPRTALDDAMAILRLIALGVVVLSPTAAAAQRLSVVSATVNQPGDFGRVCVVLSGGQGVAGIQNDLVWDGNCATLADESSCAAVGSHGKQVHFKLQQQDFRMRALALSLSDTRPMGDGPVYCCNVQSEAAPGDCCSISIVNTGGSDPGGKAVGLQGVAGQICTRGSGRSVGGVDAPRQPLGASSAGGAPEPIAPQAPAAPAGAAPAAAPPPAQVLPGGGGGVKVGQAESEPVGGAPQGVDVVRPGTPGGPSAAPTGVAQSAAAPAPVSRPATVAAVAATPSAPAATAVAQDTPRRPVDTPLPTTAAAVSTPTAAGAALAPTKSGGMLGCEIAAGASAWPLLGLVVSTAAWLRARRRRRVTDR
jgi:hypothetical protein